MRLLQICLFVGAMVFAASALPPVESPSTVDDSDAVCTAGSRWRDECNWCNCGANGKYAMCTLIGCDGLPGGVLVDEPECDGNSRWKKDCNWCNCVEGRAVCTLKACFSRRVSKSLEETVESQEEAECVQGSRWKKECNWCHCTETGVGVCTKIGCHPDYTPPRDEPKCKDGSRWKKDCNWCNCVRGRQICTSKQCRSNDVSSVCVEGETWQQDCNTCVCRNGIGACTEKFCLPGVLPDAVKEPECSEGARWSEDCNECRCRNGLPLCTRKLCSNPSLLDHCRLPAIRPVAIFCQAFLRRWTYDSASSTCKEIVYGGCGGTDNLFISESECLTSCVLSDQEPHDAGENISSSQNPNIRKDLTSSKDKCLLIMDSGPCFGSFHRFYYNKETGSCETFLFGGCAGNANRFQTAEECQEACGGIAPATAPVESPSTVDDSDAVCTAGSRWRDECNWCNCGANGKAALCTLIGCDGLPPLSEGEPECDGNSRWKKDCNWCNCVEGRAVCTLKTCVSSEECDKSQCPWQRWGHYKAKGCLPQYDGGSCCPTSFLCSINDGTPQGQQDNCTYKNKVYDLGATIDVDHDCSASCRCVNGSVPSGSAEIRCASIECPHFFRPVEPGCRPLYRLGECCPYNHECTDPQSPELELRTPTCFWNNKTYHEGDQMFFDEYPCQKCICTGNFADPLGPGCSKLDCGLDFRYTARYEQGCVPIYFEERCCPIDWLCPDDSRIVTEGLSQEITNEAEVNACILNKDPGSCHNDVTRIYYDAEASECRQFVYGGCQGNDNNFRTFEECQQSCSKTPKPSQSVCQVGGVVSAGPTEPENIKVTALLNSGHPGRMSLQIAWSTPNCPRGDIKGYHVWVKALTRKEKPHLDKSNASKLTGPLITQLVTDGLYLQQPYAIAVAAENNHGLSNLSPLVVFSLIPNYHRPDQCHLGSLSFEVGKSLKLSNCKIDCRCITPPEFTCVQYRSCEAVAENLPKDCPEIKCGAECNPVIDAITGCLSCSCQNQSFTCPDPVCPPLCETTTNYQTGCPTCYCRCPPLDVSGEPPCPMDCAVRTIIDDDGCQICECDPNSPGHPFGSHSIVTRDNCPEDPPCPLDCGIHLVMDASTGCIRCECDPNQSGNPFEPQIPHGIGCPVYPDGLAPCPMDCAIRRIVDPQTGCQICECDPNNPGNPFGPNFPLPPQNNCIKGPDGHAPCPLDCAILRLVDENTGCEICKCDPNNPGNPFAPPLIVPPQNCLKGPDGRAPCPLDCAILRLVDETTGCEICKCDPNNPGNPFRPPLIVPPQNCPKGPDGRAPCPLDCAILRLTDEETGCEVCKCDPNNPGNPFGPPLIPLPQSNNCPKGPDGRAPCPLDCAILRLFDARTGCEICKCDPNNPGNPFGPPNRPIYFPSRGVTTTK